MSTISGNNTGAVSLTVIPNEDAQANYTIGTEGNGAVYPFIRARMVTFIAQALKPNTRYYPFFNEVFVGAFCTTVSNPTINENGKIDSAQRPIVTDALGNVTGNFFIPGNTFASGSLVFKLVDKTKTINSKVVPDPIYGSAEAIYEAGTVLKEVGVQQSSISNTASLTAVVTPVVTEVLESESIPPVVECEAFYFEYTLSSEDSSTFTITTESSTPPDAGDVNAQTGAVVFPDGATNDVVYVSTTSNDDGTYSHTYSYLSTGRTAKFRQEWVGHVGDTPPDLTGFRPTGISDDVDVIDVGTWTSMGSVVCPIEYATQLDCRTDPLAQSFYIEPRQYPNGLFLTSIGIYFRTVDHGAPVIMEIRNMENGLPGGQVLPGATAIVPGKAASASSNGTVATIFRFTSPVYLLPATNYCFVVKTPSLGYNAWTSIVGQLDSVTGKVIDTQPYNGTLFKSENNYTWIPSPLEDLKFDFYKAEFDTSTIGEAVFAPKKFTESAPKEGGGTDTFTNYYSVSQTLPLSFISTIKAGVDAGYYLLGTGHEGELGGTNGKTVVIKIPQHSLQDGDFIYVRGVPTPTKVDTYNNIRADQLFGDYAVTVLDGDRVAISVSGRGADQAANRTGPLQISEVYGVFNNEPATLPDSLTMIAAEPYVNQDALVMPVYSTDDETFDQPTASAIVSQKHFTVFTNITVDEANLDYIGKTFDSSNFVEAVLMTSTTYGALAGPPSGESYDGTSKFVKYDEPRMLANRRNEDDHLANDVTLGYKASCKVTLTFDTSNKDLSPVIDTNGINLMTRSFKIDNQSDEIDGIATQADMQDATQNSEIASKGGKAIAKYKSQIIKLDKAYNSMKIFVTGNAASPATFDVYIRTSTDKTTHVDQTWTWVSEYGYANPAAAPNPTTSSPNRSLIGEWFFEYLGGDDYFDVFDIKIVMRSTTSCYVPKIYGLRTIATTTIPEIEEAA